MQPAVGFVLVRPCALRVCPVVSGFAVSRAVLHIVMGACVQSKVIGVPVIRPSVVVYPCLAQQSVPDLS